MAYLSRPEQPRMRAGALLYDHVRAQLDSLIPLFGLQQSALEVVRSFELLCTESLGTPLGRPKRDFSTVNEDGTPFQFSFGVGGGKPALQFLAEVGSPGLSDAERAALTLERAEAVAALFGAERTLATAHRFLCELASTERARLSAGVGGLFWIGVSFPPEDLPRLRIYVNSSWNGDAQSWSRLRVFASYFGVQHLWDLQRSRLENHMQPLGFSLSVCEGRSPTGRVYVRAFGNPLNYYEKLARDAVGPRFGLLLRQYAQTFLGENCVYPTKSVVCSFGLGNGLEPDFKCEFCGHCIFSSDAEAVHQCGEWLTQGGDYADIYFDVIRALTKGGISRSHGGLHSFVGLGSKAHECYHTFYLNPGATTSVAGNRDGETAS